QVRQEQHNITLPPEMIETGEVAKVEKLPTVKVPASKLDSRGRNSKVLVAKLEQGQKARQDDVSLLDTVTLFLPDTTQKLGIDDSQFDKLSTIPMMVLTGIAAQQGTSKPEMRTEVSGVASAASLLGFGSIIGSLLKYVSAFLIQYGFGPGGYGLYTLSLSLVSLIAATFNL